MKKVLIIYHSQEFGNTAKCAELVARGVRQAGDIEVEMINTNEANRVDMKALAACDGVAFGSPDYASYVAGTIKQVFDDMYIANKAGLAVRGKPCVLFMTHGGGGRGIEPFKHMARHMQLVAEPFICRGAPEADCQQAIALGL
ncbi:MAG: flavodoxin family protein, partial [Chloroflexi bacterium]|nr:flavodoxin family protein [Chloroflexota bacterium]